MGLIENEKERMRNSILPSRFSRVEASSHTQFLSAKTDHRSHRCVAAQQLAFGFASLIFQTQLLERSDLCNEFFRQFHGVCIKTFDVTVQRPEDGNSEGNMEELPPPCPSPAAASTALNIVANIAMFEDADRAIWKLFFSEHVLGGMH